MIDGSPRFPGVGIPSCPGREAMNGGVPRARFRLSRFSPMLVPMARDFPRSASVFGQSAVTDSLPEAPRDELLSVKIRLPHTPSRRGRLSLETT